MEAKLGTRWVGKGEGATVKDLHHFIWTAHPRPLDDAWGQAMTNLHKKLDSKKTNIALTGEPLTDDDLKRIAECE